MGLDSEASHLEQEHLNLFIPQSSAWPLDNHYFTISSPGDEFQSDPYLSLSRTSLSPPSPDIFSIHTSFKPQHETRGKWKRGAYEGHEFMFYFLTIIYIYIYFLTIIHIFYICITWGGPSSKARFYKRHDFVPVDLWRRGRFFGSLQWLVMLRDRGTSASCTTVCAPLCMLKTDEYVKLSYTESNLWSIKVSICSMTGWCSPGPKRKTFTSLTSWSF